MHGANMKTV